MKKDILIPNVDITLLKRQKGALIMLQNSKKAPAIVDQVDGLINLLDAMTDIAYDETEEKALSLEDAAFPNGLDCWKETYYEVVDAITVEMVKDKPTGTAMKREESQGRGGLWELADELTNKFERQNKGREWDGDFFDELEVFLEKELHPKQIS